MRAAYRQASDLISHIYHRSTVRPRLMSRHGRTTCAACMPSLHRQSHGVLPCTSMLPTVYRLPSMSTVYVMPSTIHAVSVFHPCRLSSMLSTVYVHAICCLPFMPSTPSTVHVQAIQRLRSSVYRPCHPRRLPSMLSTAYAVYRPCPYHPTPTAHRLRSCTSTSMLPAVYVLPSSSIACRLPAVSSTVYITPMPSTATIYRPRRLQVHLIPCSFLPDVSPTNCRPRVRGWLPRSFASPQEGIGLITQCQHTHS